MTSGNCGCLEIVDHALFAVYCPQVPASFAFLPPLLAAVAQDEPPALHAVACTRELLEASCMGFMRMRKQLDEDFLFVPLRTKQQPIQVACRLLPLHAKSATWQSQPDGSMGTCG